MNSKCQYSYSFQYIIHTILILLDWNCFVIVMHTFSICINDKQWNISAIMQYLDRFWFHVYVCGIKIKLSDYFNYFNYNYLLDIWICMCIYSQSLIYSLKFNVCVSVSLMLCRLPYYPLIHYNLSAQSIFSDLILHCTVPLPHLIRTYVLYLYMLLNQTTPIIIIFLYYTIYNILLRYFFCISI